MWNRTRRFRLAFKSQLLTLTSSANSSIFSSLSFHICKLDTIMVLNTGQLGGSNELLLAKCLAGSSIKKVLYELCFS